MQRIQCRWAKSLGELESTHQQAWGTEEYTNRKDPTVFFGLYDLRDYVALWRHRGKKYVLWAGSDIKNFQSGFLFNDGKLKWLSKMVPGFNWLMMRVLKKAVHYVENVVERDALMKMGIVAFAGQSFMGDVRAIKDTYRHRIPVNVWVCANEGRQEEYGFNTIERIADRCPKVIFHLYGANWNTKHTNVIVHGRVPKERMNKEVNEMQCGLRLNEFDGFSEVTAKSILMGQYPITRIHYPYIPQFQTDAELVELLNQLSRMKFKDSNGVRKYYLETINNFPWNRKNLRS